MSFGQRTKGAHEPGRQLQFALRSPARRPLPGRATAAIKTLSAFVAAAVIPALPWLGFYCTRRSHPSASVFALFVVGSLVFFAMDIVDVAAIAFHCFAACLEFASCCCCCCCCATAVVAECKSVVDLLTVRQTPS